MEKYTIKLSQFEDGKEISDTYEVDKETCRGHMTCMRHCPTEAIRVRNGKSNYRWTENTSRGGNVCLGGSQ